MEDEFQKRSVLCYSNFMKYIISFSFYNVLLVLIENSSLIYSIDLMLDRDYILKDLFTPFYFISPHLYVEILNEKFPNQCDQIFEFNGTLVEEEEEEEEEKNTTTASNKKKYEIQNYNYSNNNDTILNYYDNSNNSNNNRYLNNSINNNHKLNNLEEKVKKKHYNKKKYKKKYRKLEDKEKSNNKNKNNNDEAEVEEEEELMMYQRFTPNERYFDIKFRGHKLYSLDNSYCVYNKNLIYISFGIVAILTILLVLLFFLNTRDNDSLLYKIIALVLTNIINLFIRPFFIAIATVLVNRPLVYLYRSQYMSSVYTTEETIYMLLSLLVLIYFVIYTYIIHDYINNVFCFEKFPYDCFITSEENVLMLVKVCIGFKLTYDKMIGINKFNVINLIIGLFVFYRLLKTIGISKYIVNHMYLKYSRTFISFFCCIFIVLKLMNQYISYFQTYSTIIFVLEIIFIILITLTLTLYFSPKINKDFLFIDSDELLSESLRFFYFVNRTFPTNDQKIMKDKKKEKEEFVDKLIIGHKMKCKLDECIICDEEIYNPDITTLTLVLYSQFLESEKDFKEDEESLALLIKLMYIIQVDNKKIHRLAFNILKNLRNPNLDSGNLIKLIYLYQKSLDRLNIEDPRGLINVKHDEVNEELLKGIKNFEDILGYVRTRTEKVELVTNKTNSLGDLYKKLKMNLYYLKNSKKYGYDMNKYLEITVLVKLLFPRPLDNELLECKDISSNEFLQEIDKDYKDNTTLMLKYDFNNKTWRIKNVPNSFILHTNYSIGELLEQSLDKIFPKVLAKSRIKQLEKEVVLANSNDENLEYKTVICDKDTNIKSVKFDINVVPNLENNYSIYMRCHFHQRQLIIIDEFGNFMNGSQILYDKAGINADIIAASKGRINMFSMFSLDKKKKIEDVKKVHISKENIEKITRELFLIEDQKDRVEKNEDDDDDDEDEEYDHPPPLRCHSTLPPNYLSTFLKEQEKPVSKEKIEVFLQLFSKETINDMNYYLFTVKFKDKKKPQDMKDKNKNKNKDKENEQNNINKYFGGDEENENNNNNNNDGNNNNNLNGNEINKRGSLTPNGQNHLEQINENKNENNNDNNDDDNEDKPLKTNSENKNKENNDNNNNNNTNDNNNDNDNDNDEIPPGDEDDEKEEIIKVPTDEQKKNEEKNYDYNNYNGYYGAYHDPNMSMSMTLNGGFFTGGESITNSAGADIFGFLLMKTVSNEATSSKFQKFIYWICIFNIILILFGIACIISVKINSSKSEQLLGLLDDFNFMVLRIFSATDLFFCYAKYNKEESDNVYNNYINESLLINDLKIDFDDLIKNFLDFESSQSLTTTYQFNYDSFYFYSTDDYNEKINFNVYYIHLEPSGSYSIKQDKLKNIIDLFTLTINQISDKTEKKIFLNIKILEYTYHNISALEYPAMMTLTNETYTTEEKNQFNNLINLYQHLFNFYNSYVLTFDNLEDFIDRSVNSHFDNLHRVNEILLITIFVVNVIFVLICLFSVVFYRKVLKNEFTNLYGLSEDTIIKLQDKYKYVKELIKREYKPGSVYVKIKQLREKIESALMKEKMKKKKKESKEKNQMFQEAAGGTKKPVGGLRRQQSVKSEMSSNSQQSNSEYMQFSGACKGLFRSSTMRAKQQVNKLNKEARKAKASRDLLDRLNFDFEIVKNFILFIVFMSIFYIVLGVALFIVSENNFKKVLVSLSYTEDFKIKFSSLFNFISSIKLAMITNKESPYTIYNNTRTPECEKCVTDLLSNYTLSSADLADIGKDYGAFSGIFQLENVLEGENLCENFYLNYENSWTSYLKKKNPIIIDELIRICNNLSILKSNPDTVFSYIIFNSRKLYKYYLSGDHSIKERNKNLGEKFHQIDLIMTVFVYPYFEYISEKFILGLNKTVNKTYYIFMILVFIINIIIDIIMMLFIWVKIYHQIIRSVENVQLVNDSVSVV